MQQLMNVVTAQQQQIQMLAERPPQVVTQPLPPPSPVPTLPAQTSITNFLYAQNEQRPFGVATGPMLDPSNSFGVSGGGAQTGVTVPTIVLVDRLSLLVLEFQHFLPGFLHLSSQTANLIPCSGVTNGSQNFPRSRILASGRHALTRSVDLRISWIAWLSSHVF